MANRFKVAGADSVFKLPDADPAGFWVGFWHGLILPFTFVVSLFKPGVNIYETNNNGGWYNFGFILGASASLGGGSQAEIHLSDDEEDEPEESEDLT